MVRRAPKVLRRIQEEIDYSSYPDPDDEFILDTDASDYRIEAVLSQNVNGEEKNHCMYHLGGTLDRGCLCESL